MIMQSSIVKFHMFLHDYRLACEISMVGTLALSLHSHVAILMALFHSQGNKKKCFRENCDFQRSMSLKILT